MADGGPTPYEQLIHMPAAELAAHARARYPEGGAGLETAKRCVALLYERSRPAVRAVCAGKAPPGEVDDLEAEVYARFVRTVYTGTTPIERPAGLLMTIAWRVVATFHERRPPAAAPLDEAVAVGAADDGYAHVDADEAARQMLGLLNDRQREVVWRRVLADLPSTEVGDELGMTVANVDVVFFRAMRRLRQELSGDR